MTAVDTLQTTARGRSLVSDDEGGHKLSREEREALERMLWALEALREMQREKGIKLSLHHATALLRVAIGGGKSVQDLTREAGVAQSVMSRHLLDLGPMDRNRDPGFGLIEHRLSPVNMRMHEVNLTKKGLSAVKKMAGMVLGAYRKR